MELLPFVDILKVFNNPINEEQAWAVCYQCAHFLQRNPSQEFYQDVYDSGIHSIWLSRHGDVLLRKGPPDPNGSGKGPPHHSLSRHSHPSPSSSTSSTTTTTTTRTTTTPHHRGKGHVLATETDAVQALGTAIFEALDYGIDQSEERQLSPELESIIVTMTNTAVDSSLEYDTEAASNGDDEGIEKDADVETRCTVHDVIKLCVRHLSSKQDASHHYKAVCRALATEAGELFTFLDKVAAGKEQLSQTEDEDARRLEELQRADWACLWVQVMRSLRQGVRLKKVEHVHLPPLEYELTPFEMILEDIRSRRYTLTKIMVNGDIPHKVKNDAHAVILNFIRSRPPLKKVDERKLKPKPPSPPDPHELLLNEIRSRPKLRPVRHGKLVVEKSAQLGSSCGAGGEEAGSETRAPAKRVIKPDFNLLLNNSFEESSDDEDRSNNNSPGTPEYRKHLRLYQQQIQQQQQQQQLYPRSDSMSMTPPPHHTWQRAVTQQALLRDPSQQQARPSRLQRRHTITICEAPLDHQVALKELPVLQEEEEEQPSPVRDSHSGGGSSSSSSSLSQLRPGVLPRASHSDNDLQSHASSMTSTMTINLRQAPSLVRRASFEHRRSLTSQTSTGLTAIPEQEDDGKNAGGSTDPGSRPLTRAKSQEQCPPPNPSPPCKGRAKAGLAMVGMRPSGGPYHPNSHHASHHSRSIAAASTAATAAGVPTSSKPHTTLASMQHVLSNPSFSSYSRLPQTQHAPSSSSSPFSRSFSSPTYPSTASPSSISSSLSSSSMSSPSFLPSTLEQSPQPGRATALDRSSSSQSPAYRCPPQGTNIHDRAMLTQEDSRFEGRISRWRMPAAQYSDQVEAAPSNCNNMGYLPDTSASPRRWATGITGDSSDSGSSYNPVREGNPPDSSNQHSVVVGAGYYPETLSPEEARHKRLSLDAGMSMYYEEALKEDNTESLPSSPYLGRDQGIVRKTSVGLDRGVRGRTGFRRIKSPEEEERVTRWRALQEDERQARWRPQQQEKTGGSPVANQRQVPFRRSGVAALTPPSPSSPESLRPENTDVLQQRMADEEARFDRWRRLEEGTGSHPLLDHLNRRSPQEASPNMNLKRQDQSQTIVVAAPPGIAQPSSLGPGLEPARHQSHVASPPDTTSDLAPMHDMLPMPKRWQNPVECLSLTLEEVTHIRSVLTKAELESLMSHPDLYQQVAKSKLCFTCKTTRFALFGEWGTKCKFCKRTVCAKCLRKMNVPADHFRNIPVYTLSPTPLTSEMQDFIQDFIKGAPAPSVPATRDHSPVRHDAPQLPSSAAAVAASATGSTSSSSTVAAGQTTLSPGMNSSKPGFLSGPAKALHRSQSALVTGQRPKLFAAASSTSSSSSSSSSSSTSSSSLSSAIKGPMMAICCDCKGMVMEIIRATRASLTLLSSQEGKASLSATSAAAYQGSPPSALPTSTTALSPSASLNHSARQYLASKAKLVSN